MNMYLHVFTGSAPLQAPQESVTQQPVTPEPTPLDQVITELVPLAPAPEPVTPAPFTAAYLQGSNDHPNLGRAH
jgi:hypothetical protein